MLDDHMSALDLSFLSLYRVNGQEWPLLPGLLAQNPPKKAARGRDQDRLMVYLTLAGNVMYSTSEYTQIVAQVAETFYATSGSLTYALKTATEALNTYLVDRNMKTTSKGQYSIGALVLFALRGNTMFIVQAGPTHVYHLSKEINHIHDAQLAGKGLGLSQTARMYFAQATLNASDRLIICAALPPNWEKSLTDEHGIHTLEATRRRLLAITDTNVSAVLVQATDGSGAMNIIRSSGGLIAEPAQVDAPAPKPKPAAIVTPSHAGVQPAPTYAGLDKLPVSAPPPNAPIADPEPKPFTAPAIDGVQLQPPPKPVTAPLPASVPLSSSEPAEAAFVRRPMRAKEPEPASDEGYSPEPKVFIRPETREKFQKGFRGAARLLALSIQKGRALTAKLADLTGKALPRLLPEDEGTESASFPRMLPLFIAVVIPLVIVTIGYIAYSQLGQPKQYSTYFGQALEAQQKALAEKDPTKTRVEWETVIDRLDNADKYKEGSTPESQKLRQEAQNALDMLARVIRLDFKPAFNTSLSPNIKVKRMSASDTDIYLLDSVKGVVMRGAYNGTLFDLDGTFVCGPGNYDGVQVGNLIDIIALPRSNPSDATLLAIDASGNLEYCAPGEKPKAAFLQMPDTGWKNITAIAYDANSLYVLDAPARAVWVYFGTFEIKFPEKPYFFFQSQIPVLLEQAIGMAVNGDDLYLLNQDGHLTTCTLSRIDASPTRCNDPAIYVDTRPGFTSGIRLVDGEFSQITFTSPPNPSVALLQPYTQSIFRFSARALELQNQIRSKAGKDDHLPKSAQITAMAFSPNKVLFIFLDNGQVFFSANIP
jgi:hypothetical protein